MFLFIYQNLSKKDINRNRSTPPLYRIKYNQLAPLPKGEGNIRLSERGGGDCKLTVPDTKSESENCELIC